MQKIALRFLSGLLSGILGSIFFTLLLFQSVSSNFFNSIVEKNQNYSIDFKYLFLMFIVFISMIVLCEIHALISYLFEKHNFTSLKKTCFSILIAMFSIEVIMIPIYITFASLNNLNLYLSIMIQIVFSIILSQMIIESFAISSNYLIKSFSIILSTLVSILIILFIASLSGFAVLIVAPVILLTLLGLGSGIAEFFTSIKSIELEEATSQIQEKSTTTKIKETKMNLKHDYTQDSDG